MTLEQRIEELEKKVASLTLPSATAEELAKMMRDVAAETIKSARRPGGEMHSLKEKAANELTAVNLKPFCIKNGQVFCNKALINF